MNRQSINLVNGPDSTFICQIMKIPDHIALSIQFKTSPLSSAGNQHVPIPQPLMLTHAISVKGF